MQISVRSYQKTVAELYQRVRVIRNVVAERVRPHRYPMQASVRRYQKTAAELYQRVRADRNAVRGHVLQVVQDLSV